MCNTMARRCFAAHVLEHVGVRTSGRRAGLDCAHCSGNAFAEAWRGATDHARELETRGGWEVVAPLLHFLPLQEQDGTKSSCKDFLPLYLPVFVTVFLLNYYQTHSTGTSSVWLVF